jgi:hypothetical protein
VLIAHNYTFNCHTQQDAEDKEMKKLLWKVAGISQVFLLCNGFKA